VLASKPYTASSGWAIGNSGNRNQKQKMEMVET